MQFTTCNFLTRLLSLPFSYRCRLCERNIDIHSASPPLYGPTATGIHLLRHNSQRLARNPSRFHVFPRAHRSRARRHIFLTDRGSASISRSVLSLSGRLVSCAIPRVFTETSTINFSPTLYAARQLGAPCARLHCALPFHCVMHIRNDVVIAMFARPERAYRC